MADLWAITWRIFLGAFLIFGGGYAVVLCAHVLFRAFKAEVKK